MFFEIQKHDLMFDLLILLLRFLYDPSPPFSLPRSVPGGAHFDGPV